MDFTHLDNLLGALEKLQSLRPPSPPVVVNGHLGVWRTVRHNRLFIEILNGGSQGRVLIGPPSMVGHKLSDISDDVWAAMTPRATLREFRSVKVADNGVETLKEAIKNATGPDDTRREALKDLNEPIQLVPMARRTGFTDDEIKQALAGKSPNKALSSGSDKDKPSENPAEKPKLRLVDRTSAIGKPPTAPKPEPSEPKDTIIADKPKDTPKAPQGAPDPETVAAIDGALALITQPKSDDDDPDKDRARVVGERLDKVWPKIKEELPARKIKSMAEGLKGGLYTLSDVADMLKEMRNNKDALNARNTPKPEQLDAMEDHNKVKDFIETFDAKVEEAVDRALEEKSQQFTGGITGEEIVEEAKEESQKLPEGLQELIDENARLKVERDKEKSEREAAQGRLESERAARQRDAEQRSEDAAAQRAQAQRDREKAQRDRERAEQARREAAGARRAAMEALSASQKEKLQVDAIVALLNDLAGQVKSEQIKREINKVVKEVKTGSYNRGRLLMELYHLLQILLMLIPVL